MCQLYSLFLSFFFFPLFLSIGFKRSSLLPSSSYSSLMRGTFCFFWWLSFYFVPLKESSALALVCYIDRSLCSLILQWTRSPIILKHMLFCGCFCLFVCFFTRSSVLLTTSCFNLIIVCISDLALLLRIIGGIPQAPYERAWSCILWYPMDENV